MDPTPFTPLSAIAGGLLIAAAAIFLMATMGRIAGISGYVSRLIPPYLDQETGARLAFVGGIIISPLLVTLATGHGIQIELSAGYPKLIAAGVLVGAGTVIGSGCTSGHGVCGLARLSRRSITATLTFMIFGIATVYLVRHVGAMT